MIRQEEKAPREVGLGEGYNTDGWGTHCQSRKNEANCSSTTEGSKERLGKSNGEEEKKTLQDLVQSLERVLGTQNEYMTMSREEHNSHILKQRRALESDDA